MANEFARNLQDASLNAASFTLPTTIAAGGSAVSAAVDLGPDLIKVENFEVDLAVPALTEPMAPAASTAGVTYSIETSTTSTFAAVARVLGSKTIAGSGTGVVATSLRVRVPSNCERYIRGRVLLGTTATDASTLAAVLSLRF